MSRTDDPLKGADLRTVTRASEILFAFSSDVPELGLTQLAQTVGLSKATVHRLAQSLMHVGLIDQDPQTRAYRLGIRLLQLADLVASSLDVRQEARNPLQSLRDETGETTYLMLVHDEGAVCAERIEGSHPMRDLSTPPGTRVPLHVGAAGTAILTAHDDEHVETYLATLDDARRRDLETRVVAARERGHSFARGDVAQGVGAIAAPLVDAAGVPVGAISLGGLLARVEDNEAALASAVHACVASVSAAMGWRPAS
ncbi:IclR family transcriptional regulator [Nocardioides sp. C4-1]|uniref:IclR family transcriptional regulator n=1 Tax=Nocardioides sp. C4-1 TaxID=3151851 RepID=UPI0032675876